jgi:hypothetical protein
MPLALALAMTEQSEKAIRQKIMQEKSCSEMEAAYRIADDDYLQNKASASTDPATPSTAINISNISLNSANYYNEFQSDVNTNDNTANGNKKSLSTIISNKLSALNLSNYNAKMIRNHAEVMSCGGCHQNSNEVEIAQNVNWPKSGTFVHVDKQGVLSSALTEQFLPAQSALLKVYWQTIVEKWHFSEMDYSSARNYFGGFNNVPSYPNASAFATLQADGSIKAWGNSESGGTNAPTDKGYTKIYSTIDTLLPLWWHCYYRWQKQNRSATKTLPLDCLDNHRYITLWCCFCLA